MLIALSGVQGSGKTTVLNGLKDLGFQVIERKTARSVLTDWNVSLEQVYADQELCKKFHDELLERKLADEAESYTSTDLRFTERSFTDLFTYALISLGHFNQYSEWLDSYYEKCKNANEKYVAVFFLNTPYNRSTENDGVRGINKHYVRQVNKLVTDIGHRMSKSTNGYSPPLYPLIEVTQNENDRRVRFVAEEATSLWLTGRLHVDENFYPTTEHPDMVEAFRRQKEIV